MVVCISLYLVNTTIFIFTYVCYNTTCFSPLCGPSSGVSRGMSYNFMEEGGREGVVWGGGEISLCGLSYYVMHYVILVLIFLMFTVARGVLCFCLYDTNCLF